MTYRQKLLATIAGSYVIACLAVATCLGVVTTHYEAAVESAENAQLDGILNRQIEDLAWDRHAENVRGLARDISQEPQMRRLVEAGDRASLYLALLETRRRAVVSSGEIVVLGLAVLRPDGSTLTTEGSLSPAPADLDIEAILSRREGIDRLKILTRVWISQGRPVLTVTYPIGGLRPVGYLAVHADPLVALSNLDQLMGMAVNIWSVDGSKQLATLNNWKTKADAQVRTTVVAVAPSGGTPVMTVRLDRDVAHRLTTMQKIRIWSFASLIGLLVGIALVSSAIALRLTRRIADEEANERSKIALENMGDGLCMFDGDKRVLVCNTNFSRMYGLSAHYAQPGTHLRSILERRVAIGNCPKDAVDYVEQRLMAAGINEEHAAVSELQDGRFISIIHKPTIDGGWIAIHRDITVQRRSETRIAYLAQHDALTGLSNRSSLRDYLEKALAAREVTLAVHCLDLDRFKNVNDTLGHPVGDALLKAVAERLRGCVREGDLIARLGGDEFAIVQKLPDDPIEASGLAARLVEAIGAPYDLDAGRVTIATSIGIAVAPQDGTDPDTLIRHADLALYQSKREGRGAYRFFETTMNERMQSRHKLEQDLREALGKGELKMFYQPLVNLEHNEVSGFESLMRWCHPERGMVSPAEFIPIAEDTGLIVPLGEWALRRACTEASTWPDHVKVAVNVSASQFKSGSLVQTVVSALAASGLPPNRLELEITESVLLQDTEATLATMQQLHTLGVGIALDDFGTGYSSLAYLRRFPFAKIKIDRFFVADLSNGGDNALAILRAVTDLGSALGMTVTAEGVETAAQREIVQTEGCTDMQGYLFSAAKPAEEIRRYFSAQTTCLTNVA